MSEETKDGNVKEFKSEGGVRMLAEMNQDVLDEIKAAAATLDNIASERGELNARSTAVKEGLAAKYGVNRHAMAAAIRYSKLNDEQRENFDLSYLVTRKALSCPMQNDLFEAQLIEEVKRSTRRRSGGVDH